MTCTTIKAATNHQPPTTNHRPPSSEPDCELSRPSRQTFERKLEAVGVQNLLRKSQSDALTVAFRAEERREEIGMRGWQNPAAGVFNHDEIFARPLADSNGDAPVFTDRFSRVLQHVHHDLFHLTSIHLRESRRIFSLKSQINPPPSAFGLEEEHHILDQLPDIRRLQVRRRQAEDIGEVAHEGVEMIGSPDDHSKSRLEIRAVFGS